MKRLVLLSSLCLAFVAHAEDAPPAVADAPANDALLASLRLWHRGERFSGLVAFTGTGVGSLVSGGLLAASNSTAARGAGWVMVGFGALELAAGLFFGLASFGNEERRAAALMLDRKAFIETERARMKRITGVFQPILLGVETAIAVGGGITAGVGALRNDELAIGLGLGLAVQGVLFFLLDWAVSDRAHAYALALEP